jgi:hypothetical protein
MSRWSKGDGCQAGLPRKLGLMDEVRGLPGGMGNQGDVVRPGSTVRRPPSPHSPAIRPLLNHLAVKGFVAPVSIGVDEEGREVCRWIEGQVAVAPFPDWSVSDEALASVGLLLRRYHGRRNRSVHRLMLDGRVSSPTRLAARSFATTTCVRRTWSSREAKRLRSSTSTLLPRDGRYGTWLRQRGCGSLFARQI